MGGGLFEQSAQDGSKFGEPSARSFPNPLPREAVEGIASIESENHPGGIFVSQSRKELVHKLAASFPSNSKLVGTNGGSN